ncbi:MAG: tRNA (adenosine(37)-N6)-threonylcarbamoyltransferase complex dimerization subunit type 1 TsaB [Acidibrevibacterium sp.]|uniref:tRNA (adenosine(37)-N6)-threonylcarbamoyltransferase complex dimerization subunit type 1 TsaB n=1 Tax=Acidibrevibacterium sp. TaxID=2606776 RepID=UPI003D038E85
MRILGLDAAFATCSVALSEQGRVCAERVAMPARGQSAVLATLLAETLAAAPGRIDLVAVMIGPGGFTGLRAALALAQGFALGHGATITGVTLAETLAEAMPAPPAGAFWVALPHRLGGVFIDGVDGTQGRFDLAHLPAPPGAVTLAGEAAALVAEQLTARGIKVYQSGMGCEPAARLVAAAAARRLAAGLPPRAAQPVYAEPPAAIAAALRPPPA